jgi:hypothetical protein
MADRNAYLGLWRPHKRAPWVQVAAAETRARAWDQLPARLPAEGRGGESVVVPAACAGEFGVLQRKELANEG